MNSSGTCVRLLMMMMMVVGVMMRRKCIKTSVKSKFGHSAFHFRPFNGRPGVFEPVDNVVHIQGSSSAPRIQ